MSRVVEEIATSRDALDVVTIMTLLKKVIPFFPSLNSTTRLQLRRMIAHSFPFLCNMVSFIAAMPKDLQESRIYKEVLIEVLKKESCLKGYIVDSKGKLERNTLKSVFFGSKLFNVLVPELGMMEYLELLEFQWTGVFDKLLSQTSIYGELLSSMLILHPTLSPDLTFGRLILAGDDHFECFQKIVSTSTLLDQQRLLKLFLSYLQMHTNLENCRNVFAVLKRLPLHKVINLDTVLNLNSQILQEVVLRLLPREQNTGIALELTRKFAEAQTEDEKVCWLFVIMLRHKMDPAEKKALSRNSIFLDAVTKRLGHEDAAMRERTMYIAKLVSNGELEYESEFTINIPDLDLSEPHIIDYKALQESEAAQTRPSNSPVQDIVTLTLSDDSEATVFIKDLLKKYEGNDRKHLVPLLQLTVKLLRQKKDFPLEVNYYSSALLPHLVSLTNALEEPQFEHWRINSLVSLLVVTPEVVQLLLRILFTSEHSLQQRLSLLSSMSLAARELRGESNGSVVVKPQYDFPTRRLPWDKPTQGLIEKKPKPGSAMSKTVWRSKKLDKESRPSTIPNHFRKHARSFFYPLAQGWFNGIELGNFDKLFKSHYIQTLTIIYQCSYPHADYDQMTETMLQVTRSALQEGINT